MVFRLVRNFNRLLQKGIEKFLIALVYIAIGIAFAHRVGWLDRWIWFVLEKEAQKALNGAQVTIGSFTIEWSEILQGRITLHASNVVIHTPQRDEWQWDSPLIARIGKSTVECNALITVFHAVFLRREVPIEAYTIIVSDVQVFVERRKSVINVYLLNPTLQLPPPPFTRQECDSRSDDIWKGLNESSGRDKGNLSKSNTTQQSGRETQKTTARPGSETAENHNQSPANVNKSSLHTAPKAGATFFDTKSSINPMVDDGSCDHDNHNQQAKVLVNEMLHAVQVLGGAAARGQLSGAIKRQGLELVGRLQGFRENDNLEEGIRVMQQVGKVAVESIQTAPQLILPQPDTNLEGKKKILFIRIGRICANDLRIFTKDSWINEASTQEDSVDPSGGSSVGVQNKLNGLSPLSSSAKQMNCNNYEEATTTDAADSGINHSGSWNKPIHIKTMVLRSSELCSPMSLKDDQNLPAIFQTVDKVLEVVWRRVLAEIAKSNTGRLFSTAMGEVLSVIVSNPQHSIPFPPTAKTAFSVGSLCTTNTGNQTMSIP